jgi:hypothetical protein
MLVMIMNREAFYLLSLLIAFVLGIVGGVAGGVWSAIRALRRRRS